MSLISILFNRQQNIFQNCKFFWRMSREEWFSWSKNFIKERADNSLIQDYVSMLSSFFQSDLFKAPAFHVSLLLFRHRGCENPIWLAARPFSAPPVILAALSARRPVLSSIPARLSVEVGRNRWYTSATRRRLSHRRGPALLEHFLCDGKLSVQHTNQWCLCCI